MLKTKCGYPDCDSDEESDQLIVHLFHEYSTKFHLTDLTSYFIERGKAFYKIHRC